ncbi:MAG: alpha/beta hydrolase [Planctomycetota bacterium]
MPYQEPADAGNAHRAAFREQTRELIRQRFRAAAEARYGYFQPSTDSPPAWADSVEGYREDLRRLLGWPLVHTKADPNPALKRQAVVEDEHGTIERIHAEALPGWWMYALLFLPTPINPSTPPPLVIAQHGGGGTPELAANLFRTGNYGDMVNRLRQRGLAVVAPQCARWSPEFDPELPQDFTSQTPAPTADPAGLHPRQWHAMLTATGGSLVALESFGIQRLLTAALNLPELQNSRVGMLGLSYGGMLTLLTAALDTRIAAAAPSACLHDGSNQALMHDLAWPAGLTRFTAAELAGLICPRPLALEIGKNDTHHIVAKAEPQAQRVRSFYTELGIPDRFLFNHHDGKHEIDTSSDTVFDFLDQHLRQA